MAEILVVDDDREICSALEQFLAAEGHRPTVASNAEEALRRVASSPPELVLLDVRMPGTGGLEALARLRATAPDLPVVMMTAYGGSRSSIEAMRLGAFDYVLKPFELDVVKSIVDRALEAHALSRRLRHPPAESGEDAAAIRLVGRSRAMQEVYKLIGVLAARDMPALLTGERGTGKSLVARTIHESGGRRDSPFVAISCRALPEEPLSEELVGRETGKEGGGGELVTRGKLETAAGGTLLIEHVDELSLPLQARLLRTVDEGIVERLGGGRPVSVDVQILAASERDLGDAVRRGEFNEKLFDRLRVFSISLPALRDRRQDLAELTAHLVARCNRDLELAIRGVDERVEKLFAEYPWPGNVGELEMVVRRAAALARSDVITPADLGDSLREGWYVGREEAESALDLAVRRAWRRRLTAERSGEEGSTFHQIVAGVEEALVREALAETGGNQVRAARLLGVTRGTLRAKIERYGI